MKRNTLFLFLVLIFLFFISGCDITKTVKDYSIDLSNLPEDVYLDNFSINDIKLNVIYTNDTVEVIELNENMLNDEDEIKLLCVGEHEIEVNYANIIKIFNITINERYYKITFLDINGNVLEEQMVLSGQHAIVPDYNIVEDYVFVGLSSNKYRNVHQDAIISPIYEQTICTVKFIVNGELIEVVKVDRGTELDDLPELPYFEGYLGKWDIEEDYIMNK